MRSSILLYIIAMALTTYLIRMIPFTLFKRKITSTFALSFFYYMPYAVLSAMTFPFIFHSTGSLIASAGGTLAALIAAFKGLSITVTAIIACVVAFALGFIPM